METVKKRNGRPRKAVTSEMELPNDGAPQHLQDMRHVYLNPEKYDRTQGQKTTRQYFLRNPSNFMAQMFQMEREFAEASGSAAADGTPARDIGTENCLRLAEKLIKAITEGQIEPEAQQ